jgi:Holliday junction resolvasome RuvABC endonuclease subunit
MISLGIDQSLSNTGVVILDGDLKVLHKDRFGTKPGEYLVTRVRYLADRISGLIDAYNPDIVSVESTTFGSHASETLMALYQFILNECWFHKQLVCSPAPRQVHRFMQDWARSSGVAFASKLQKKDIVALAGEAARVKFRQDEADAYWIARIGLAFNQAFNRDTIQDSFSTDMLTSEKIIKDHKKGMIFNEGQAYYDFREAEYPYRNA